MVKTLSMLLLLLTTAMPALAAPVNTSGPWGIDAGGFKNFSTALASPKTVGKTVLVSKPMTINNKTTDRAIRVIAGGKITVASGKTFAVKGPFDAGVYEVFDGTGTVTGLKEKYPEWFSGGLATAMSQGGVIKLTGTYTTPATANGFIFVSNTAIIGASSTAQITGDPATYNLLFGDQVSNITVKGVKFVSTKMGSSAVMMVRSSNIKVSDIVAEGCSVFHTYQHTGSTYATITESDLSDNIKVEGCTGSITAATPSALAGIGIFYARNAIVRGNKLDGYVNGIETWGGQPQPGSDATPTSVRKAHDITIANNIVDFIGGGAGGGIFAIHSERVNITGNVVRNAPDVGIDFESSVNCTATGNTVIDARNGGLSSYYLTKGILFSGNTVVTTYFNVIGGGDDNVRGRMLYKHSNTQTGTSQSEDVSLVGNIFDCQVPNKVCVVGLEELIAVNAYSGIKNFVISGNTFKNTVILDPTSAVRSTNIAGNTFVFTDVKAASFQAVKVSNVLSYLGSGGNVDIRDNNMLSTASGAQPAGTAAIQIDMYSPVGQAAYAHRLFGNNTWGFPSDAVIVDQSSPAVSHIHIMNNLFSGGVVTRAGANLTAYMNGNLDYTGAAIP